MIQTVCDFCHKVIDTDRRFGEIILHDASKGAIHNAILESRHLHICNHCLENSGVKND